MPTSATPTQLPLIMEVFQKTIDPFRLVIRMILVYGTFLIIALIQLFSHAYHRFILCEPCVKQPTMNGLLTPNMVYRYCGGEVPDPVILRSDDDINDLSQPETSERPLVLVLSWTSLVVKDRYLEKYRQFWYRRGFDVLTVRMSPLDVIFPQYGGLQNAKTLINFLANVNPRYEQVLIHGFCGGGYQFCELLYQLLMLRERQKTSTEKYSAELILQSFRGFIADSISYPNGYFRAVGEIITNNRYIYLQKVIEIIFAVASVLANWMVHYHLIYSVMEKNERAIPALFLYSINDHISDYRYNANLYQRWKERGILVCQKCWDRSVHAEHYRNYPEEYGQEVDCFIGLLPELGPLTSTQRRRPSSSSFSSFGHSSDSS